MPYDAMPTEQDLCDFLTDTGLEFPQTNLGIHMNAAIELWNTKTGWVPYLAETQTRYYDPPGPHVSRNVVAVYRGGGYILELDSGLISITSLSISTSTDYVENVDFTLRPSNALLSGEAYTEIEFKWSMTGMPNSIQIIGLFGRVTTVPDDVWEAILGMAACKFIAKMGPRISGGLTSIADEKGTVSFARGVLMDERKQWKSEFDTLARLKKRVLM